MVETLDYFTTPLAGDKKKKLHLQELPTPYPFRMIHPITGTFLLENPLKIDTQYFYLLQPNGYI